MARKASGAAMADSSLPLAPSLWAITCFSMVPVDIGTNTIGLS